MPSLPEHLIAGVRDIELSVEEKNERDRLLNEQPMMKFLSWTPQLRLFFLRLVRKYGVVMSRGERIKSFIALSRGMLLRAKLGSSIISGQTLSQKYTSFIDLAKREILRLSGGRSILVKEVADYLPKLSQWERECMYSLGEERGIDLHSFNRDLGNRIFILGNLSDLSPATSPTKAVLNEIARLQAKQLGNQGFHKEIKDASSDTKAIEDERLSGLKRKWDGSVTEGSRPSYNDSLCDDESSRGSVGGTSLKPTFCPHEQPNPLEFSPSSSPSPNPNNQIVGQQLLSRAPSRHTRHTSPKSWQVHNW